MTEQSSLRSKNQALTKKLMFVVVGMFIFAVGILPPMYDAICDITGLNGKTDNKAASSEGIEVVEDRIITVQFIADTDPAMSWSFKPNTRSIKVHPGEIHKVDFNVKNPASHLIVGQAIPSISPAQATSHFKKTECFCFHQQELDAGKEKDMPLIFYIDPDLPKSVSTITLSYKLYDITDRVVDVKKSVATN